MRRILSLTLACLVGAGVSACKPSEVVATEKIPTAGVRFINAVPDTAGAFGLDFRFVDIVESNAHYKITFRNVPSTTSPFVSTALQYKGARAGSRHFRVFEDDTLQSIAQLTLADSTVALKADSNYTAILWGNARSTGADKMRFTFVEENVPNYDTTKVFLRVINATNAPIDVRAYLTGGTVPATATWAAVPAYSFSNYVSVSAGSYLYNVQPAGGGATLFTDATALPGAVATCDFHACLPGEQLDVPASPGTSVAGSAVTGIVFPKSVVGSRAPQGGAFANPAITFTWDKRPPLGCKPTLC
jgi:hypothetical protein